MPRDVPGAAPLYRAVISARSSARRNSLTSSTRPDHGPHFSSPVEPDCHAPNSLTRPTCVGPVALNVEVWLPPVWATPLTYSIIDWVLESYTPTKWVQVCSDAAL